MIKKIFSDALFLWSLLISWANKIDATRVSTGQIWRLHNFLAGSFWITAFSTMAALNAARPLPWDLHLIYAWAYVILMGLTIVFQIVVFFRGHYFFQPKIIP